MIRYFQTPLYLGLSFVIGGILSTNGFAQDLSTYKKLQESVVKLITTKNFNRENPEVYPCTAVFVSSNEILTVKHCLGLEGKHYIRTFHNKFYNILGVVAAGSGASDMALLRVDIPENTIVPLKISSRLPKYGELLTRISFFDFGEKSIASGPFLSFFGNPLTSGTSYTADIELEGEMSGSPIVNQMGEIVGIASSNARMLSSLDPPEKPITLMMAAEKILQQPKNNPVPISEWWKNFIRTPEGEYLSLLRKSGAPKNCGSKKTIDRIHQQRPQFAEPIVYLGYCNYWEGNFDEAVEYFEQSRRLKENPEVLVYLAVIYATRGGIQIRDSEIAEKRLKQAMDLVPYKPVAEDLRRIFKAATRH